MGIVKCEIHGRQGFYEICGHLRDAFDVGEYPKMVVLNFFDIRICRKCDFELDFSAHKRYTFDELIEATDKDAKEIEKQLSKEYDRIPRRRSICTQCYLQAQLDHARKIGNPDPFEAFEYTLTDKNQDSINTLQKLLKSALSLHTSWNPFRKKAITSVKIKAGHLSAPLTISFHNIGKTKDQDHLLAIIDDFFVDQYWRQRIVHFYNPDLIRTEEVKKHHI